MGYEPNPIFDYRNGYRIMAVINDRSKLVLYDELFYRYNNSLSVYIFSGKLFRLIYHNEYFIKFLYKWKLDIDGILNIYHGSIKFHNDKNILSGYNNFTLYYSCGRIFISSANGYIAIYYKEGGLFIEFKYSSKFLFFGYYLDNDNLSVYSPYGTRLM
jgi:hypothetical protein